MNPPSTNPYNDQPTIRLLDLAGAAVAVLSQREAAKLLRAGQVELVFAVPPAVRLLITTEQYETLRDAPADDAVVKALFLHARRSVLYGNVHFQNPRGETMFHADHEKALWYLNRELVEVVSVEPPVLRFRFEPGGSGHVGDEYYLSGKVNRCVVCGITDGLNRHHVVPSVYRRHLPAAIKDHSHHDVLLLCLACHERYESAADDLKAEFGAEHGVPLHGLRAGRDEADEVRNRAIKSAVALVRHGTTIPPARREELLGQIRAHTGEEGEPDIEALAALAMTRDGERIEHGEQVIAQTADVQAFIIRWRRHFLATMQPRYLPAHWDIERPAVRGRGED